MAFMQVNDWQIHDHAGRRKYISAKERDRFLRAADDLPPAMRALAYVLVFTGCRISEALALTRHQLDADSLTLTLSTLKRRSRVFRRVPIPHSIATMLIALPQRTDHRFWSVHRTTAWRAIKRTMLGVGIVGPMACCKGLRHGFGIRAAEATVPHNLISKWMGHASLATTAIYVDAVGLEERAFAHRMW